MRNHKIRPEDIDAPPSPLLKNYREFSGVFPTPEESLRLFGNQRLLRQVYELAAQSQPHLTPPPPVVREGIANGK